MEKFLLTKPPAQITLFVIMKIKIFPILTCTLFFILQNSAFAVDTASHITDREIVERLTRLEEGQKKSGEDLRAMDKGLNKRIDDLRSEMNSRFGEVNHRFDTLQWMLGLFITIALVIFGFILRLMWLMHRKQAQMETTLEMQKNDVSFIKGLIEKLLPHKGAL